MNTGNCRSRASADASGDRLEGSNDMVSEHRDERSRSGGEVCDGRGCQHRELLRHTLVDAIETLETTRKAFKSKQIEALRRRLTRVLIEEG